MTHQEFKARFLPCHKKMYYIAFRYLGNEYDAEDMVQNTYLKLWEKRESLENIEKQRGLCHHNDKTFMPRHTKSATNRDGQRFCISSRDRACSTTRYGL